MAQHGNGSDNSDYSDFQDAANEEYEAAYRQWRSSLSAEEIAELTERGVDEPDTGYCTHTPDLQPDFDRAAAPLIIPDTQQPMEQNGDRPADWQQQLNEVAENVAILIIDAQNPRLEADTLAFACGFHARMGRNGTELSLKYGLSRAAWSKRCVELRRRLGLSPSVFMRSERVCQSYKHFNGATPQCKH